jgi:hypothetical protein
MTVATTLGWSVAIGVVGCAEEEPILLPAAPGISATVVVIEAEGRLTAEALEGDGEGRALPIGLGDEWVADILRYERPLNALALVAGPLTAALPGAASRALPNFDEAIEVRVVDGESLGFQSIFELGGPSARFRLPVADLTSCLEAGGCLDGEDVPRCLSPCPEPTPPGAPADAAPPQAPEPPQLLPCAPGWSEHPNAEPARCEPPARQACLPGTVQWQQSTQCTAIGSCPPDQFLPGIPSQALHVDPNGGGGDGSAQAPFATLDEALLRATAGATISLARGTYAGPVLSRAVKVVGACAAETVIQGEVLIDSQVVLQNLSGQGPWTITASARALLLDVELAGPSAKLHVDGRLEARRIVLLGSTDDGLVLEPGAQALIEGLVGRELSPSGLRLTTASATISELVLEQLPGPESAVRLDDGAHLTLHQAALWSTSYRGLELQGGSTMVAQGLLIRDTLPEAGIGGVAILVGDRSHLGLERAVLSGNRVAGVLVQGRAQAELRDLVVEDTKARLEDQLDGQGLIVSSGARVHLERSWLRANTQQGILVRDLETHATFRDLTIVDTRPRESEQTLGVGLYLTEGAQAVAQRVLLSNNVDRGISVHDGATLRGQDLKVDGVESEHQSGERGMGLWVASTATVALERFEADNTHRACIEHSSAGASRFVDITCRRNQPTPAEERETAGLYLRAGTLSFTRVVLEDHVDLGILVEGLGTVVTADDLSVRRCSGRGVALSLAGEIRGTRWRLEDNGTGGLDLQGDARLDVSEVIVEGSGDSADRSGIGVLVEFSRLHLERFRIVDNQSFGLSFGSGGLLLEDGLIAGHRVGLIFTVSDVDPGPLLRRVAFRDNDSAIGR